MSFSPWQKMVRFDTPKTPWFPKLLWVGVGCGRLTPRSLIETAIQQVLQQYNLEENAIAGIATLDSKGNEPGLVELCEAKNWPLRTFSSELLRSVQVPNPSARVGTAVGTPSVAEAAALQAAGVKTLLVSKQIYRGSTVAIAQAQPKTPGVF